MSGSLHSISRELSRAAAELAQGGMDSPRLDAEVLLAHCLKTDRAALYRDALLPLDQTTVEVYRHCIARRMRREPVAYITGVKEFRSLEFIISRDVLIPRPETETLVEEVIRESARYRTTGEGLLRVLEVGTGSGIIAVTLAREVDQINAVAVDCSHAIVSLARSNARMHTVDHKILFYVGDLCRALKVRDGAPLFHLICSNPPYLSDAEWFQAAPEIRDYEPESALRAGPDGLACYRMLIPVAASLLRQGGCLALEIGHGQAAGVAGIVELTGLFGPVVTVHDLSGNQRVIKAHRR